MKENSLLNDLAHEFCQRLRQGEHLTIDDYAIRCPQLADGIRDLFPMLLVMEGQSASSGEFASGTALPIRVVAPQQVAEYRIVREIRARRDGVVYQAIHESLQRRVALKILPAGNLPDARHIERFQREARAAAHLRHANIVPIFDVGEADGLYYYAMLYIDGRSLNRPLPDATALIGRLAYEAVRQLHGSGCHALPSHRYDRPTGGRGVGGRIIKACCIGTSSRAT